MTISWGHNLKASALAGAAMIAIAAVPAHAQASTAAVEIDIEAQDLGSALTDLALQADVEVMFSSRELRGKRTRGVEGRYTPEEAIRRLLQNSGVPFRRNRNGTLLVGASYVQQASNEASQPQADDQEEPVDIRGNQIDAEPDRNEIVVTGTNIRGVENPTVPVLTFDREDIELSGAATLDDFLRTIPQNFASETQLTNESGNPNDSGRNQTQGTSVDLRGLGAGSTLTLLNGRRMTVTGEGTNVDINVLPLGVIERVDVLTDGASAIYGSDAVGGAVNFITRKDYEGFDINARYGTVTEGSKEDFSVGGAGGFSWGSGGVFAGVDYQELKPLFVEERDFVDLTRAREGATLGSDSERFSVAGGINQDLGAKARLGIDVLYSDISNESLSLTNNLPIRFVSDQIALFINSRFEYKLTDSITASVFMDYGRNRVENTELRPEADPILTSLENDLLVYEGQLSGQLFDLPGGAVSFSVGALYREEQYDRFINGVSFITADRNVTAGYAEALVPIIGGQNALPLVQKLELSLAGRYEDYNDVGDSLDPKIGVYWEINDDLSLRASYSESFRAPDLNSLNAEQGFFIITLPAFFFTAVAPSEFFATVPSPSYLVALPNGGNPDLSPESATTWSAGFSYEPSFLEGFSIQGNYFDISYSNRLDGVVITDPVQDPGFRDFVDIPPNIAEIEDIFARGAAGEIDVFNPFNVSPADVQALLRTGFQNIAERDVRGFDINLNYTKETDFGRFSAGANASYLIDFIARASEIAPPSEQINIRYRPVDFRLRGNVTWSKGGFTAFTAINYTDGYRDNIDRSIANTIDAWTTVDLSFAYDTGQRFGNIFVDGARIGISVTNLFDEDPPFVLTPFGLNFDSANANPFGRQVNFTISKTF